jgi:glycosyltransferase involved in cell wall biosynthesis
MRPVLAGPMVLGVDAYRAVGARTGVGRNLEYLLDAWGRREVPFEQVRVFAPAPLPDLPANERMALEVLPSSGPGLWWQIRRLRPRAARTDVLFGFYTLPPGHRGRSVVANLGIYEGAYAFPGWRSRARSWHYAQSARQADTVIVNAESTKADLVNFYRIDPDKIVVIWPGADQRFRPSEAGESEEAWRAVERLLGERCPYFLFVGKLSLRRCVPELLEAFSRVRRERPELRFLLAGPNSADLALDELIASLGLDGSVRHVQHLDQDTLALLYRRARAFLMPTTHEGFSHPIPEALGSGCPVMALRDASVGAIEYLDEHFPGGAGEAVVLADDPSPDGLAAAMERLADDDALCARLSEAGVRAAATFPTWDEHADAVMDVLARVADTRP